MTSAVCNCKKIWNEDKCRCECTEDLVNKMVCDKGYIWNPSNRACECDKSCGIGQYLDYKSFVSRNCLLDKLVEECTNVTDSDKIYNETLNKTSSNACASCTPYVVLFVMFLLTSVIISSAFVYFHWHKKTKN